MSVQQETALQLHQLGINVVPAPAGAKSPVGSWKRWQSERLPNREVTEAFAQGSPNLFVITGSVSRLIVLDCDDKEAVKWWREQLGPTMEQTTRVKTSKGFHFWFRLEEGEIVRGRASTEDGGNGAWDVKAEGGGVIAPPSIHENGCSYEFVEGYGIEQLQPRPDGLLAVIASSPQAGREARSVLSDLLERAPAEGGRNNWLAQVAGHYARIFPWVDAYDLHVEQAAAKLVPPLPEDEVYKLKQSIWNSELAKQGRLAPDVAVEGEDWRTNLTQPSEESGWLVSGRTCILVQVRKKEGDKTELALDRWLDADLRVVGIIESEQGRTYEIELTTKDGTIQNALPASAVTDQRRLDAWLANHGVSIGVPDYLWPKRMGTGTRLVRYLEAQGAPTVEGVPALGWHDESEAFLTHDGLIRAGGPSEFENVRPLVDRSWAPYRYGFSSDEDAIDTLREVLTFHDQTVAAVFGAWWAACLIKPHVLAKASQFPFMALEATSESGKTTGFFSLMLQLSGNTEGHNIATRAALRDYLSAHRNGIVWLDDLDSLEYIGELLRASTVEGGLTKKGADNQGQIAAKMRAALVVSGENLGFGGQKALLDRAILLGVGSPVHRRSFRDPELLQWSDIERLKTKYPDLTVHAGTLVRRALGQVHHVKKLELFRQGAGRHADKLAILRLGARVLRGILGDAEGDKWITEQVDKWTGAVTDPGAENALTLRILPAALARFGWPSTPEGADRHPSGLSGTPAFVQEEGGVEVIWFNTSLLAEWWAKDRRGRGEKVEPRTESEGGLQNQPQALGLSRTEHKKNYRLVGGGYKRYWMLNAQLSQVVLNRSRG